MEYRKTSVISRNCDLEEVRRIVVSGLEGYRARVYLFGSFVTGAARCTSDIDVAILPLDNIPHYVLSEIRDALDRSLVLYPVDLVDLSQASEKLRVRVLREGVLWSE